MSEFQPQEPTEIQFCLGNHEISFSLEDNPRIHKHEQSPEHDFFVFVSKWRNAEPQSIMIIFREVFDRHGIDYDELFDFLDDEGVDTVQIQEPLDGTKSIYDDWKSTGQVLPILHSLVEADEEDEEEVTSQELVPTDVSTYQIPHPEEDWGNTKKVQADKWGGFVAYLAESIANGERAE